MEDHRPPSADERMAAALPKDMYRVLHLRIARRLSVELTAQQLAVDPADVLLLQHQALRLLRRHLASCNTEPR